MNKIKCLKSQTIISRPLYLKESIQFYKQLSSAELPWRSKEEEVILLWSLRPCSITSSVSIKRRSNPNPWPFLAVNSLWKCWKPEIQHLTERTFASPTLFCCFSTYQAFILSAWRHHMCQSYFQWLHGAVVQYRKRWQLVRSQAGVHTRLCSEI